MEDRIELNIVALSKATSSEGNFVLVLEDASGKKRLPMIIGPSEAQYIGILLENLKTKRPLTHELLANIIHELEAKVRYILIKDRNEDVFHADIYIQNKSNVISRIDARVSDAIAIAVRTETPIFILRTVMEQCGQRSEIFVSTSNKTSYLDYSLTELEDLLKKVVEKEDYESAVRIREAIDKTKNKK